MNFKEVLKDALRNNSKIIITGKSGWGKSEMIQQVADEEGYELVDFRLSEVLPEDIVGIPKVRDDYYEYVPPLWLYNILQNPDKKYLLFLDEITQGTPEVLNICYKIFDKVTKIGNHELPNVAVVGATNYADESRYLSELPIPLKRRACMMELDHNSLNATTYLMEKYKFDDETLKMEIKSTIEESNPRSTDKAIELILNDACKELVVPYIGLDKYKSLATLITLGIEAQKGNVSELSKAMNDISKGYVVYKEERYKLIDRETLDYIYDLNDEEKQIIDGSFKNVGKATGDDLRRDFFTQYAIDQEGLSADEFHILVHYSTFNPIKYIKKFKINQDTFKDQFEAICSIFGYSQEELLRVICTDRQLSLPIMKMYRNQLPWDLLADQASKGWLTAVKMKEFKKELEQYGI